MRRALLLTAGWAVFAATLVLGGRAAAEPDVTWRAGGTRSGEATFLEAVAAARKEGKPIVLLAWDDDDAPFRDTEAAFHEPAVRAFAERCVFVRIDCEARFWRNNLREAFDAAPFVYVLDPRLGKPCAAPLVKVAGEHRAGGGIPAERLAETLKTGLAKYEEAEHPDPLPEVEIEGQPAPGEKPPAPVEDRAFLGVTTIGGVPVATVAEGSPAAKAGFKGGDVIIGIDGARIQTHQELQATLARHEPGDAVKMVVVRDAKAVEIEVTLGSAVEYLKAHPPGEEEEGEGGEGEGGEEGGGK